jgi:3-hydroxyisobutyrate dehydrogenase-like beta-hydroxyacid dehydrogenase
MADDVLFERVALIGIGLIGSSLARLIKRDGLAGHIVANARSQATLDKVVELGIADSVAINVADAVAGADLVIICSRVPNIPAPKRVSPICSTVTGAFSRRARIPTPRLFTGLKNCGAEPA